MQLLEELEDTKGVIIIRKSKMTDNIMAKRKRKQKTIYKTEHRKLKIGQRESF